MLIVVLCGVVPMLPATAHAGIARADVAPDGNPRNDIGYGDLAIASSVGPFQLRGPGEAYGESDTAAGTLTLTARSVNLQSASTSAEILDSLTIVPLPGTVPTGPVPGFLILDFNGDIDLDNESGDALASHALITTATAALDHVSAPGSSTILDRARTVKTYAELTQPLSPSVDGPRMTFANQTTSEITGTGIVSHYVTSRVRFSGRLILPFSVPVGQPYHFEAFQSASVASGMGYIAFIEFANGPSVSLQLPAGYTFSSASGVLLSTPVPEPGVALQLLAGTLGVALVRTRRRRPGARCRGAR